MTSCCIKALALIGVCCEVLSLIIIFFGLRGKLNTFGIKITNLVKPNKILATMCVSEAPDKMSSNGLVDGKILNREEDQDNRIKQLEAKNKELEDKLTQQKSEVISMHNDISNSLRELFTGNWKAEFVGMLLLLFGLILTNLPTFCG